MLCEECGNNPATVRVVIAFSGQRVERQLCASCMAKSAQSGPMPVDALLNVLLIGPKRDGGETLVCPDCRMTYQQLQKGGRLGCPACYEAFRPRLSAWMHHFHGASVHAGRAMEDMTLPLPTLAQMDEDELEEALESAIAAEDFEKAATLRDRLRARKDEEIAHG